MTHQHHHCNHVLVYCEDCDLAYCSKCHKEWGQNIFWTSMGTTTIGDYTVTTSDATGIVSNTAGGVHVH